MKVLGILCLSVGIVLVVKWVRVCVCMRVFLVRYRRFACMFRDILYLCVGVV